MIYKKLAASIAAVALVSTAIPAFSAPVNTQHVAVKKLVKTRTAANHLHGDNILLFGLIAAAAAAGILCATKTICGSSNNSP